MGDDTACPKESALGRGSIGFACHSCRLEPQKHPPRREDCTFTLLHPTPVQKGPEIRRLGHVMSHGARNLREIMQCCVRDSDHIASDAITDC